jgi:hypothetical protein
VNGEIDRESTAGSCVAAHLDPAVVVFDYSVRDREPEPAALADILGREERLEDVGQDVGRDSRAVIRDRDPREVRFGTAVITWRRGSAARDIDGDPAVCARRLQRVDAMFVIACWSSP